MKYYFQKCMLILLCVFLKAHCRTITESAQGRNRMKREPCLYGYGDYEGRQCCKCPPGFHVVTCDPITGPKCEPCERESFLGHANLLTSCEPCKSCNPNANLEKEEDCSVRQNTVCRCTKGFYCDKIKEECNVCHSCKKCEGDFAIEKECTSTNNTVCKKVEKGGPWWIILILISIVAIVIIGIIWCRKKKRFCFTGKTKDSNQVKDTDDINELTLLKGIDLAPHLSSIVLLLGPNVIRNVVRGDITDARIEFHEENAPNNAAEKSYNILREWCEQEGLENGAPKLIEKLNKMGKRKFAEEISKLIRTEKRQ